MHNTSVAEANTNTTGVKTIYSRGNQYKKIPDSWKQIKRYTNIEKGIAPKSRFILSTALHQIDKYGEATLTHEELSLITETKPDQNCILVKQLGFVLHSDFFRSKIIKGKKYRDGYTFTLTKNALKILENPIEFFANFVPKSIDRSGKEIGDMTDYNRGSQEPLLIYTKNKYKNDNTDNQDNQFQNSNFLEEKTEQVETEISTENIECDKIYDGLAEEEIITKAVHSSKNIEFVENIDNLKINTPTSKQDTRPTEIGLDGKTYWTTPLINFKYSEKMLKEIISKCNRNRQHYTPDRVITIIKNIIEKYPDKKIRGGRIGFEKYMIAAINGENDYTEKGAMSDEEKLTSIAEQNAIKAQEIWDSYLNGEVQYDY
jgi:hypothetical protein